MFVVLRYAVPAQHEKPVPPPGSMGQQITQSAILGDGIRLADGLPNHTTTSRFLAWGTAGETLSLRPKLGVPGMFRGEFTVCPVPNRQRQIPPTFAKGGRTWGTMSVVGAGLSVPGGAPAFSE